MNGLGDNFAGKFVGCEQSEEKSLLRPPREEWPRWQVQPYPDKGVFVFQVLIVDPAGLDGVDS